MFWKISERPLFEVCSYKIFISRAIYQTNHPTWTWSVLSWSLVSSCRPRNGGRFCVGRRMKFRSCNTEPCPRGRKDFREEQCSHFDGKHFNINGLPPTVRWVPKYSGSEYTDILLKPVLWILWLFPLFRRKHTPVLLNSLFLWFHPLCVMGQMQDSVPLLSYFAYTP